MDHHSSTTCFSNVPQMYPVREDHMVSSSLDGGSTGVSPAVEAQSNSLLYNLSILKEKIHQVQSLLADILISPEHQLHPPLTIANVGSLVQEIIVASSAILFACQQISINTGNNNDLLHHAQHGMLPHDHSSQHNFGEVGSVIGHNQRSSSQGLYSTDQTIDWYGDQNCNPRNNNRGNCTTNSTNNSTVHVSQQVHKGQKKSNHRHHQGTNCTKNYDIIELDAADLLAKYTHYCQVCGKGFKRDANLRMHMRAHGDEYKSRAALTNPMKHNNIGLEKGSNTNTCTKLLRTKKYSCPQEGCRWNQKHSKFQPLKSMICAKNHYKRTHCPKMYVCKRCNRKQFSVLSDLRTHEKHCGDLKWQCSCGTTFSRKDKLMGHVALFVGHTPAVIPTRPAGKLQHHGNQMDLDGR